MQQPTTIQQPETSPAAVDALIRRTAASTLTWRSSFMGRPQYVSLLTEHGWRVLSEKNPATCEPWLICERITGDGRRYRVEVEYDSRCPWAERLFVIAPDVTKYISPDGWHDGRCDIPDAAEQVRFAERIYQGARPTQKPWLEKLNKEIRAEWVQLRRGHAASFPPATHRESLTEALGEADPRQCGRPEHGPSAPGTMQRWYRAGWAIRLANQWFERHGYLLRAQRGHLLVVCGRFHRTDWRSPTCSAQAWFGSRAVREAICNIGYEEYRVRDVIAAVFRATGDRKPSETR